MRHRKDTFKIGRTTSHRRCMMANMVKSLVEHGRIRTTLRKAKELRREADKCITLAKKDAKRLIKASLMLRYNPLSSKDRKKVKEGDLSSYNGDRKVLKILDALKERFKDRQGGYTRIIKEKERIGDSALMCYIEFVE